MSTPFIDCVSLILWLVTVSLHLLLAYANALGSHEQSCAPWLPLSPAWPSL